MDFDLDAAMRQVWEETFETDKRKAAQEVLNRILDDTDKQELLLNLLGNAYTGMSPSYKRTTEEFTALNDQLFTAIALDQPGVAFKDMTVRDWHEFAKYCHSCAQRQYLMPAQWIELNILKLAEHGVSRSGELPDDVKWELFEGKPEMPGFQHHLAGGVSPEFAVALAELDEAEQERSAAEDAVVEAIGEELGALMRQVWNDTHERDSVDAAEEVTARMPGAIAEAFRESNLTERMTELFADAYHSMFLAEQQTEDAEHPDPSETAGQASTWDHPGPETNYVGRPR